MTLFRNTNIQLFDRRTETPKYRYVYHIRHLDHDFTTPATIEKQVTVNYLVSLSAARPLFAPHEKYSNITEEEIKTLMEVINEKG